MRLKSKHYAIELRRYWEKKLTYKLFIVQSLYAVTFMDNSMI